MFNFIKTYSKIRMNCKYSLHNSLNPTRNLLRVGLRIIVMLSATKTLAPSALSVFQNPLIVKTILLLNYKL